MQGAYFLATGIWPLVSVESFQMVTGPKTDHLGTEMGDHWLLITVGVLITVVAVPLLTAACRRVLHAEVILLAIGSALGLTEIEIIYVWRGAIPPIYLLDAALEVLLLFGWCLVAARGYAQTNALSQAARATAQASGHGRLPLAR